MNWLLITTRERTGAALGSNIGDEFARMGIEKIIRCADPKAVFLRLDKEQPENWDRIPKFDKAVICGMPLFWSTKEQTETEIWWWEKLWNGPVAADKNRLIALGVGHVLVGNPEKPEEYVRGMNEAAEKSFAVVVREPVAMAPDSFIQSICPSAYAMHESQVWVGRRHRLCNLMLGGGHFGHIGDIGAEWIKKEQEIADLLLGLGFMFCAHTAAEREHARNLGWPEGMVLCMNSAYEYLGVYGGSSVYIGNRMHGAAVCAAVGTPTLAITHDSRVGMVKRLGGTVMTCSEATQENIAKWYEQRPRSVPEPGFEKESQWSNLVKIVESFRNAGR